MWTLKCQKIFKIKLKIMHPADDNVKSCEHCSSDFESSFTSGARVIMMKILTAPLWQECRKVNIAFRIQCAKEVRAYLFIHFQFIFCLINLSNWAWIVFVNKCFFPFFQSCTGRYRSAAQIWLLWEENCNFCCISSPPSPTADLCNKPIREVKIVEHYIFFELFWTTLKHSETFRIVAIQFHINLFRLDSIRFDSLAP